MTDLRNISWSSLSRQIWASCGIGFLLSCNLAFAQPPVEVIEITEPNAQASEDLSLERSNIVVSDELVEESSSAPKTGSDRFWPMTEQGFDLWLQETFDPLEQEGAITSAGVIVIDGDRRFSRTYGMSDIDAGTPLSLEQDHFMLASLIKPMLALAMLQLREEGKIASFEDQANDYLPSQYQIPDNNGRPILLHDLLFNSSGFDDSLIGHFVEFGDEISAPPSEFEFLLSVPSFRFPTGHNSGFKNYEAALTGLIIEALSGMSSTDYITQNIMHPLGIRNTVYNRRQADNPALITEYKALNSGELAVVPRLSDGAYMYIPSHYASGSVADMARFMELFLSPERLAPIIGLKAEHLEEVFQVPVTNRGMFLRRIEDGYYVTKGRLNQTHCALVFHPEKGTGVTFCAAATKYLKGSFIDTIFERLFPDESETPEGIAQLIEPYEQYNQSGGDTGWIDDYLGSYVQKTGLSVYMSERSDAIFSLFQDYYAVLPTVSKVVNEQGETTYYYRKSTSSPDSEILIGESSFIDTSTGYRYEFLDDGDITHLMLKPFTGAYAREPKFGDVRHWFDSEDLIIVLAVGLLIPVFGLFIPSLFRYQKTSPAKSPMRAVRFGGLWAGLMIVLLATAFFRVGGIHEAYLHLHVPSILFFKGLLVVLSVWPLVLIGSLVRLSMNGGIGALGVKGSIYIAVHLLSSLALALLFIQHNSLQWAF